MPKCLGACKIGSVKRGSWFCCCYTGEAYHPSLALDAVNKTNHMAHAGNDEKLEPHINHFLNKGVEVQKNFNMQQDRVRGSNQLSTETERRGRMLVAPGQICQQFNVSVTLSHLSV